MAACIAGAHAIRAQEAQAAAPADPGCAVVAPAAVRQGDPVFVSLAVRSGQSLPALPVELSIRYPDGSESPRAPAHRVPRRTDRVPGEPVPGAGPSARPSSPRAAWMALVGVPTDAPVGTATVVAYSAGVELATVDMDLRKRTWNKETLVLNAALTRIRAQPDPRKDEQAEHYNAVLLTVDPGAVYLDGGFSAPLSGNRRTAFFGDQRTYKYSSGTSAYSVHAGIDYGYPTGTPVSAPGRGKVVMAEERITTGLTVIVEHLPGVYTIYMHLSRMDVLPGQIVERGQSLGAVGSTGLSTGPHLHWELRVLGVACDPEALLGIDKMPDFRTMMPAIEGR